MKKKLLVVLLTAVMALSLVACAEGAAVNSKEDSISKNESTEEKNDSDETDKEETTESADNVSIVEEIVEEITDPYANIVNSTITLGHYEDRDLTWIVLDVDEAGRAFVLIEYRLEEKRLFSYGATWDNSPIREWLNNDFYNAAFSDAEKECIFTTSVETPDNVEHGTEGGENTEDKVFLLSADEVYKYLTNEEGKLTYSCPDEWGHSGSLWLRTPGENKDLNCTASTRGDAVYDSAYKNCSNYVCPVMYVDLSKIGL